MDRSCSFVNSAARRLAAALALVACGASAAVSAASAAPEPAGGAGSGAEGSAALSLYLVDSAGENILNSRIAQDIANGIHNDQRTLAVRIVPVESRTPVRGIVAIGSSYVPRRMDLRYLAARDGRPVSVRDLTAHKLDYIRQKDGSLTPLPVDAPASIDAWPFYGMCWYRPNGVFIVTLWPEGPYKKFVLEEVGEDFHASLFGAIQLCVSYADKPRH